MAGSEGRVNQLDGTEKRPNVVGNVVTVASDITVDPTKGVQVLVDFDLEHGLNLAAGTFTPKVQKLQVADQEGDVSSAKQEQDPEQQSQNETDLPDLHQTGEQSPHGEHGQHGEACAAGDKAPADGH